MTYDIAFKSRSIKDLQSIPKSMAERILDRIEAMREDLAGDVKRLTNFTPEYRLRVGEYRILFEVESDTIVIYRVKHRSNAYGP